MHELENGQVARRNYNDAKQRKRVSRTSNIQTHGTRDKQHKNKQRKNPMTITWIQRQKATIPTLTRHSLLSSQTQHTDYRRRALKCECTNFISGLSNNETTPKIIIHFRPYPTTSSCIQRSNSVNATWTTFVHFEQYTKILLPSSQAAIMTR